MNTAKLANYTTQVDAEKSAGEIRGLLATHGARQVVMDYDESGVTHGISFAVLVSGVERGFKVPVNADAVYAVMQRQSHMGKVSARFVTHEQANRVAWRIAKDWVRAQMAILEVGMVKLEEVFLPYLYDGRTGQTFFQRMESSGFLLLAGKKEDNDV